MSQIFLPGGRAVPVTALEVPKNLVVSSKNLPKDGYLAIQVGAGDDKHLPKPQSGHLKSSGARSKILREVQTTIQKKPGDEIPLKTFSIGETVKVRARSKGKGFSGVIKRHGFHRGPQTHGSDHHRAPGSIGSMFPQRVIAGRRMPGRLGGVGATKQTEIVAADENSRVLFVKGPVPGPNKGWVVVVGEENAED